MNGLAGIFELPNSRVLANDAVEPNSATAGF